MKRPSLLRAFLYLGWESNPHSEEHEFESCASTNSATQALNSERKFTQQFDTNKVSGRIIVSDAT